MSRAALEARIAIRLRRAGQTFDVQADLRLEDGVLVLFGPSGAGKSLTIQALAGLIRPSSGMIRVGGELLFDSAQSLDVPAHCRRIGYVPQHHSLFPFRSVAANVAFGLPRRQRHPAGPRVQALLRELGIEHLAMVYPGSLSGGERQRVALARALAVEPRLLLLDEPFAAIDREGRAELLRVLRRTLQNHGMPAVVVTHDPEEALELGQKISLFERGRTVASGDPGSILGAGRWVEIAGSPAGEPVRSPSGRLSLTLSDVHLEGPEELLDRVGEGRIVLRLRTPPEDSS